MVLNLLSIGGPVVNGQLQQSQGGVFGSAGTDANRRQSSSTVAGTISGRTTFIVFGVVQGTSVATGITWACVW